MNKLPLSFYLRENVLEISRELIGKFLVTNLAVGDTKFCALTSGMIAEVEAYNGVVDKASHAYNNRRTKRNEVMYSKGGVAYVYLCYGIHHLFNVVTNNKDVPHAILVRAIIPTDGTEIMMKRRYPFNSPLGVRGNSKKFTNGPGTVSTALGIKTSHSGIPLTGNLIWIEDRGIKFSKKDIVTSPRIGVDYAAEDALLPYRFRLHEEIISRFSIGKNSQNE